MIKEVDNRKIGDGKPGKITKLIQNEYSNLVKASNNKYYKWLTKV